MKKHKLTAAQLKRRRLNSQAFRNRTKIQKEKGKVWVCLYKHGLIFSEPVFVDQADVEVMRLDYDGAALELRVLSAKKAKAVKVWLYENNGTVHAGKVDGITVEGLYPACADVGPYQAAKTCAGASTDSKGAKNGRL